MIVNIRINPSIHFFRNCAIFIFCLLCRYSKTYFTELQENTESVCPDQAFSMTRTAASSSNNSNLRDLLDKQSVALVASKVITWEDR